MAVLEAQDIIQDLVLEVDIRAVLVLLGILEVRVDPLAGEEILT